MTLDSRCKEIFWLLLVQVAVGLPLGAVLIEACKLGVLLPEGADPQYFARARAAISAPPTGEVSGGAGEYKQCADNDGGAVARVPKSAIDSAVLDVGPMKLPPPPASSAIDAESRPLLKDDPRYNKYSKMLRMGLPKGTVAQAMCKDGLDSTVLGCDTNQPLDGGDSGATAAAAAAAAQDKEPTEFRIGEPFDAIRNALSADGLFVAASNHKGGAAPPPPRPCGGGAALAAAELQADARCWKRCQPKSCADARALLVWRAECGPLPSLPPAEELERWNNQKHWRCLTACAVCGEQFGTPSAMYSHVGKAHYAAHTWRSEAICV